MIKWQWDKNNDLDIDSVDHHALAWLDKSADGSGGGFGCFIETLRFHWICKMQIR